MSALKQTKGLEDTQKGFNNTQSSFATNPASLKGKLMSLEVNKFKFST